MQPMVDYLGWLGRDSPREPSATHLRSLDRLGEFFAEKMDAADAGVVTAALQAAATRFINVAALGNSIPAPAPPTPWPEASPFEAALLAGSQHEAFAVVNRCIENGRSLIGVELHVVQPSLYHIGEEWQANRVSVAKEHMATAIAVSGDELMGLLRSPPSAMIDRRVLLACVAGNNHSVGLRTVADAFQLTGWDVQYLGADVHGVNHPAGRGVECPYRGIVGGLCPASAGCQGNRRAVGRTLRNFTTCRDHRRTCHQPLQPSGRRGGSGRVRRRRVGGRRRSRPRHWRIADRAVVCI